VSHESLIAVVRAHLRSRGVRFTDGIPFDGALEEAEISELIDLIRHASTVPAPGAFELTQVVADLRL